MKMSKRERKAFNQGREAGYLEGYAKGLHDGNPFNALIDACVSVAKTIAENPELLQQLNQEELIIEGDDEE